jgi:hypothetical protein
MTVSNLKTVLRNHSSVLWIRIRIRKDPELLPDPDP